MSNQIFIFISLPDRMNKGFYLFLFYLRYNLSSPKNRPGKPANDIIFITLQLNSIPASFKNRQMHDGKLL